MCAAGGRYRHPARATDQPRSHRHQARTASHLRLRLGGVPQAPRRSDARRNQEPSARDPACAAGRQFRLCPGAGIEVPGRHCRDQDQFEHRRSVRGGTRRGDGFPADVVGRAGSGPGRRRSRRPPSCRSLAHLPQGVSQLRPAQDRHRLAQEDIRSKNLPLLQGRVHSSERPRAADGGIAREFRSSGIRAAGPA